MINRILKLGNSYNDSTFLWGARQVGKTTLIRNVYFLKNYGNTK